LFQALAAVRPNDKDGFVIDALARDVPAMKFSELVRWTRHFSQERLAATPRGFLLDAQQALEMLEAPEEQRLVQFLSAVPLAELRRLHALYYVGRQKDDDPPAMFRYLRSDRMDVETLVEDISSKMPLDEHLGEGLNILAALAADPDGQWHVTIPIDPQPHDFIKAGNLWRMRKPGSATYSELRDLIEEVGENRLLVSATDEDMGPYSACIKVKESAADHWCKRGYRRLTEYERLAAEGEIEDYTEGWKHSE
jgi:hypothetical protein